MLLSSLVLARAGTLERKLTETLAGGADDGDGDDGGRSTLVVVGVSLKTSSRRRLCGDVRRFSAEKGASATAAAAIAGATTSAASRSSAGHRARELEEASIGFQKRLGGTTPKKEN